MLTQISASEGYYCCDKTKLNQSHLEDHNGILLVKNGNSFGWDLNIKRGQYKIALKIKWLSKQTTLKRGNLTMTLKLNGGDHIIKTFKNKLANDTNLISFNDLNFINNNKINLLFSSTNQDIIVEELVFDHEDGNVEVSQFKHDAGLIGVKDNSDDFKEKINSIYREISISKHIPYTNYVVSFNGGCFKPYMDDKNGIMFKLSHLEEDKSFIIASNMNADKIITDDYTGILLPMELKTRTKYKLFLKITHQMHKGQQSTYYHAFCGLQSKSYWHYMGTMCQYGFHTIGTTFATVSNNRYNGHLNTRVFKYGNGWSFDKEGTPYPIEKMESLADNHYNNGLINFDSSNFMVKLKLGGYISTTTPNNSFSMNRHKCNPPTIPKFNLESHIEQHTH